MKENNRILEELTERTREILQKYRPVFEQSLAILIKEEILSGDQFRELLRQCSEKITA